MTRTPFGALIALALASAFVATWPFRGDLAQSVAVKTMARPLAHATSWRFIPELPATQSNIARLASDAADLLVVGDAIGPDGTSLTSGDVARLQGRSSGTSRLVLAHIGLAEVSVRDVYWESLWSSSPPVWFDAPVCDARQSYPVKFWDDDWQTSIVSGPGSEIDRIVSLRFDGVYLTGLGRVTEVEGIRPSAKRDMMRLIEDIAAKARAKRPGFIVMVEAEPKLLADMNVRAKIDGIGLRGLAYGTDGSARRRASDIAQTYEALRPWQRDGTPAFAVEFATEDAFIDRAALELRRRGIVPGFETPKPLDPRVRDCGAQSAHN